ncbi:MAG: hypothetical protein MUC84_12055 [Solirubrobacteraceae bacterium]|jgi:hypothetical protein|nr:hypothetical protein [Solirubrobacteraceae bacterium]MCU0314779.1 hypothetical protein [Solirubrobacteraceae bacterium]
MPARAVAFLTAYLAERDVVVTSITRQAGGGFEVCAQGERVQVGAPAGAGEVSAWAHEAADAVVARLGNRMLPR